MRMCNTFTARHHQGYPVLSPALIMTQATDTLLSIRTTAQRRSIATMVSSSEANRALSARIGRYESRFVQTCFR